MAALLVALSIMAVMMTVAMPVWKQTAQREKEEELVFRGLQNAHAIGMFQRKFANAYPPNVDVLVEQRFLRKKFKDPITNDEFVPIPVGTGLPGIGRPGNPDTRSNKHRAVGRRPRTRHDAGLDAWIVSAGDRTARSRRSDRTGVAARWHRRAGWGRHQRRHEQEQRRVDSPVQRTQPLQRVGVRLHAADSGGRSGWCAGDGAAGSTQRSAWNPRRARTGPARRTAE